MHGVEEVSWVCVLVVSL
jgi:hypothetical protein